MSSPRNVNVALSAAMLMSCAGWSLSTAHAAEAWMPFGVPMVLSERFDESFEDLRTHRVIQQDVAMAMDNPHWFGTSGDPRDLGPRALCFAPGSSPTPEQLEEVNAMIAQSFDSRYQLGPEWPNGPEITLRWSFVPDGTLAPNLNNVNGPSALFATLDAQFGNRNWINLFEQSFARWGALTGIRYERVQVGGNPWDDGAAWGSVGQVGQRGDVRIAMRPFSNNDVLAFNSFPTNGDMVVNQNINWAGDSGNNFRFARNVIMHEHGHGLGLAHTCPLNNSKLMEPFLAIAFDGPQQDDVRGAHALYGDNREDNQTSATADNLGTLNPGTTLTLGTPSVPAPVPPSTSILSIDNGDQDWFEFTLAEARLVTFRASPIGTTYSEGPQTQACNTGTNVDALRQADVSMTVLGSTGATIYRTANDVGLGAQEVISSLLIPSGRSYVRITEVGTPTQVQMYTLQLQVGSTSMRPTASDAAFADRVAISWPSVPGATGYRVLRNTTDATLGATTIADALTTTSFSDTTAEPGTQYFYFTLVTQPGSGSYRAMNSTGEPGSRIGPVCGSIDFNGDGLFPDDSDLVEFLTVLAGGACSTGTCGSIDFNGDGLFPDDEDLVTFLRVLAGGDC